MKIAISRKKLADLVSLAAAATSSKPTMPALSHVLLTAVDGHLTAHATNLDRSITAKVEAQVKEPGSVLVHARKLASIAKELPAESVEISLGKGGTQLVVASGGSLFRVSTINTEEAVIPFADMAFGDGEKPKKGALSPSGSIQLPQATLRNALKAVSVASSADETRYTLNGTYFHFGSDAVSLIATDGRRLHRHMLAPDKLVGKPANSIIPGDTVGHMLQLLGENGTVSLDFHPKGIRAVFEGADSASSFAAITLLSKVVDGNYPNYEQVIPKAQKHFSDIDREMFVVAVRRIALVCDEKSSAIHLGFEHSGMQLSAQSSSLGEGREKIEAGKHDAPEFKMGMNPRYISDALQNLPHDKIRLVFNNELEPLVVTAGADFTAVLMPTRLS
jgi:DNA polymerase-3 subunit beta